MNMDREKKTRDWDSDQDHSNARGWKDEECPARENGEKCPAKVEEPRDNELLEEGYFKIKELISRINASDRPYKMRTENWQLDLAMKKSLGIVLE